MPADARAAATARILGTALGETEPPPRYACDSGEPGKSTSARTRENWRKSNHAASTLADVMLDALNFEASR
jgi:hypothetical protein